MTVTPADALVGLLAGFGALAVFWLGYLVHLLARTAFGGEARGE